MSSKKLIQIKQQQQQQQTLLQSYEIFLLPLKKNDFSLNLAHIL